MAEKDLIFETKVKATVVFDFKEFYRFAYDYITDEGYDIGENKYVEKVKDGAKEIDIEWEAEKKISDYFKYIIKTNYRITGLVDVEAKKGDKTIKTNKGTVEIKIKGSIVKDYESKWETYPWTKFFRGIYEKYVIYSRVRQYEDKIWGDCDELAAQFKSYFALQDS